MIGQDGDSCLWIDAFGSAIQRYSFFPLRCHSGTQLLFGLPLKQSTLSCNHRPLLPVPLSRYDNTSKSLPCSSFVIHWSAVRAILCKSRLTQELALSHLMCLQSFQLPAIKKMAMTMYTSRYGIS